MSNRDWPTLTPKTSVPLMAHAAVTYFLLLPFSLVVAAVIWAYQVSGVLYLCDDSLGIFDFIPPFVHTGTPDVYYVPAWRVYFIWGALIAAAVLIPAALLWWLCRVWKGDEADV